MSEAKSNPKELSVLVVDDEVILCQSVEKVLRRKGHTVDTVTSVAEALKILDAGNNYDLAPPFGHNRDRPDDIFVM